MTCKDHSHRSDRHRPAANAVVPETISKRVHVYLDLATLSGAMFLVACGAPRVEGDGLVPQGIASALPPAIRAQHRSGVATSALTSLVPAPRHRNGCYITFDGPTGAHAPTAVNHCRDLPSLPNGFYEFDWAATDRGECHRMARAYARWCKNAPDVATHAEWIERVPNAGQRETRQGSHGCEIILKRCDADPGLRDLIARQQRLFDAFHPAGEDPWTNQSACHSRGADYADHCQAVPGTPVETIFRSPPGSRRSSASTPGCAVEIENCGRVPGHVGTFPDTEPSSHLDPKACLGRARAWRDYCRVPGDQPGSNRVSAYYFIRGRGAATDVAFANISGCRLDVRNCPALPESHDALVTLPAPAADDPRHQSYEACVAAARVQLTGCHYPGTVVRATFYHDSGTSQARNLCTPDLNGRCPSAAD